MQYTPAFLTGATAAEDTAATWAALTNTGKFTITVNGTERADVNPNFTGDTTMALVAASIQTALRAATGRQETVVWSTDHFVISSADTTYESAITVCSTPSAGADLSSATYMDCAANATVTAVSASLGMTVDDLYKAAAFEIFGDAADVSLDANQFRRWLNDGYQISRSKIKEVAPNFDIVNGTAFDITSIDDESEQIFSLETYAPDCATILRVDMVDDDNDYEDETTPLLETEYDEKITKTGLRWCRQNENLIIRGIYDDYDNITVRYRKRVPFLIAATDRPDLPNQNFCSILVDYVVSQYYKQESMEVDYRQFFGDAGNPKSGVGFYGRLYDLLDNIQQVDEPANERVAYTTGINLS